MISWLQRFRRFKFWTYCGDEAVFFLRCQARQTMVLSHRHPRFNGKTHAIRIVLRCSVFTLWPIKSPKKHSASRYALFTNSSTNSTRRPSRPRLLTSVISSILKISSVYPAIRIPSDTSITSAWLLILLGAWTILKTQFHGETIDVEDIADSLKGRHVEEIKEEKKTCTFSSCASPDFDEIRRAMWLYKPLLKPWDIRASLLSSGDAARTRLAADKLVNGTLTQLQAHENYNCLPNPRTAYCVVLGSPTDSVSTFSRRVFVILL